MKTRRLTFVSRRVILFKYHDNHICLSAHAKGRVAPCGGNGKNDSLVLEILTLKAQLPIYMQFLWHYNKNIKVIMTKEILLCSFAHPHFRLLP